MMEIHHVLERGDLVKIGVDTTQLDFIQADLGHFRRNFGIRFSLAETITLHSKIRCFAHNNFSLVEVGWNFF
jgi:hypothetical protein